MSEYTFAFEAWKSRPAMSPQELSDQEKESLTQLKVVCEQTTPTNWWNDYVKAGANERGNHYGVHFGFEGQAIDPDDFSRRIADILLRQGFEFCRGIKTQWEDQAGD